MLYVSRLVWYNKAGIVDTDDGTEEVICCDDIAAVNRELKLGIRGVVDSFNNGMWNFNPYQPPETMSQLQVKTQMVNKVVVLVNGGAVVALRWNPNEISNPVSVRLSDFASKCGDCLFRNITPAKRHVVTVIFDDNITMGENSLVTPDIFGNVGQDDLGVVIDVHEITNMRLLGDIYWQLLLNPFVVLDAVHAELVSSIVDDPGRRIRMAHDMKCFVEDAKEREELNYDKYHEMWLDKVESEARQYALYQ